MRFLIPTMLSLIAIALDVELVFAVRRVNTKATKLAMEYKMEHENKNEQGQQEKTKGEENNAISG